MYMLYVTDEPCFVYLTLLLFALYGNLLNCFPVTKR